MHSTSLPINTLDVSAAVLAAILFGILVSYAATHRLRRYVKDVRTDASRESLARISESLHDGSPATAAWHQLVSATSGTLDQLEVRLVAAGSVVLPSVARLRHDPDGRDGHGSAVLVPHGGALVALGDPRLGQELLVTPRRGLGAVEVPRAVLIAFADHIGLMASSGMLSGR